VLEKPKNPIHHKLYIVGMERLVVSLGWLGWRNGWDEWNGLVQ
jgi:hypothetical protein